MNITLTIHESIEDEVVVALRERANALEKEAADIEKKHGSKSSSWKEAAKKAAALRASRLRELADTIENGDDF